MSEYIEHLSKEGSMMSSALADALSPYESINKPEPVIKINSGIANITVQSNATFSLDNSGCEIIFSTGTETLNKIQNLFEKECVITFHEFDNKLRLVSYSFDGVGNNQMTAKLKFAFVQPI